MKRILLMGVALVLVLVFSFSLQPYLYYLIPATLLIFIFFKKDLHLLLGLALPSLALGALISLEILPDWTYEMTIAEILLLVAFFCIFLDHYINSRRPDFDDIIIWLLLYLALGMGSMFWIDNYSNYFGMIKVIAFSAISYFLAYNLIDDGKKFKLVVYGMLVLVLALSSQIFLKFYELGMNPRFFFDRSSITVPLGAIALTSATLVFMLPTALAFAIRVQGPGKLVAIAAEFSGFLAIFLSLGKGAIASLMLGLGYFFLRSREKRKYFLIGGAVFAAAIYLFFHTYLNSLFIRLADTFVDSNSSFRIKEYQVGFDIIRDNLIIGAGIGQQPILYQQRIHPDYNQLVNNFMLQAAIDLGIVGFTVLLAIMGKLLVNSLKYLKRLRTIDKVMALGLSSSLIAAFFNGLIEVTFFTLPYAIVFWTMVGSYSGVMKRSVEKPDVY